MPSPITHTAAGYAVYRASRSGSSGRGLPTGADRWALLATLGLSLLPDLDFIPGIVAQDLEGHHNQGTHSLVFGPFVALAVGAVAFAAGWSTFRRWFWIALCCYETHVILDFFSCGRGVLAFWPLSHERFGSPVTIFYGVRWTEGWWTHHHLWTVLTELLGVILVVLFAHMYRRRRAGDRIRSHRRVFEPGKVD